MSRRALVTGGAGFIGSHLVEGLLAAGWAVRILDDFSTGRTENLAGVSGDVDVRRGDIREPATVAAALDGVEVVFHEAAIPSVPQSVDDPRGTDAVNVHGTLELLEGARRAGVARFVLAASCAAYGDGPELPKHEGLVPRPASPYALQKVTCEHYGRLYSELHGLPTVSLRYFNVYGPRQNPDGEYAAAVPIFVRAFTKGEAPTIFGDGGQTRDFVYVGDVVRANLLAVESEAAVGRVVNVASGARTSIRDLVREIRALTGSRLEPRSAPPRAGDVRDSVADLEVARRVLGYTPSVDLREGLRRTLEGARTQPGGGA